MPQRLKLIVAYDGASFAGWQSQSHRNTVQDYLERAFRRVSGSQVHVHGAGRTDAGVHALGQCAHVDVVDRRLSATRWTSALNALLPPLIRVLSCRYVPADFHARFSAKGKVYRYRIWSAPVLPPLEFKRAWHISGPLDFDILQTVAEKFVGTHDFGGFAANRGKHEPSTIRTIHSIHLHRKGPRIAIDFDGDGFLYKMVRLIVGSMAQSALGKLTVDEIVARLVSTRLSAARFAAPAQGLYLVRVRY
jgi:tRNA pseudouridine38-40 synthase